MIKYESIFGSNEPENDDLSQLLIEIKKSKLLMIIENIDNAFYLINLMINIQNSAEMKKNSDKNLEKIKHCNI